MQDKTGIVEGKVVIVTGGAGGIGRVTAQTLADNGAQVVISDVVIEKGEAVAAELGNSACFVPCDITDIAQVQSMIDTVVDKYGRLDVMVNNAGINTSSQADRVTVDQYPEETWHKIINVDLNGTFYCCKAAAAQMVKQQSGSIINISSVAGVVALRLQIGFVAAKAAIIKMTEAMACELGPMGIRVNVISPGSIFTEGTRQMLSGKAGAAEKLISFIPQRRPGEGEDIAGAVLFLASDQAGYVNGHNLVVDGGWTAGFSRDF